LKVLFESTEYRTLDVDTNKNLRKEKPMQLVIRLQDLLEQDDTALEAASNLLGQKMAVLDCDGIDELTTDQMDLLFGDIPRDWDFLALNEVIDPDSLSDALANEINLWMSEHSFQSDPIQKSSSTLTATGIDRILSFLPMLEQRGAKLYRIDPQQNPLEPCIYSNEMNGFLQALHDEGVILLSFNWGVWLEEANEYVNDEDLLRHADLLTIQKLLTTQVRAERFNSGNLAELIDNGHLVDILRRLAVLRAGMNASPTDLPGASPRLTATRGDIAQQPVDAIVNSTTVTLDVEGTVSEAIHTAAGPGLKEECRKLKSCAVGQAKLTHGHHLAANWVIHTVAPVWQGGTHQEEEMLAQCYRNCLALATLCPIETLAFPAIGTGSHAFPLDIAARIAIAEVDRFLDKNISLEKIIFVCHSATVFDTYCRALKAL